MVRRSAAVLLLLAPALVRADSGALSKAEAVLARLSGEHDSAARFRIADEAQALCQKAIEEHPRDARPHLLLSRALTVVDPEHPEACRPGACERAVAELKAARVLDSNGVEAEPIASELGIVLSRVGAFAEALVEYDRALRLVEADRRPNSADDNGDRAVLYGNSAETLMALGRLSEAIERYRQAEAASNPNEPQWELAEWGLGVALDRDEQVEKSRAAIQRALDSSPTLASLSEDGVFFEPAGDKRYYEALGHEVAGDRKLALDAWRDYLIAQPRARWSRRARAHLDALKKAPMVEPRDDELEVAIGEPAALHTLRTPAQLSGSLRKYEPDLRLCYARRLRTVPRAALRGELRLNLEIAPQGWTLPRVRAFEVSVADAGLVHCVELAANRWRFDPVEGEELESIAVPVAFGRRP